MQLREGSTTNITFPTLMPVFACVLGNEQFETSKISDYSNSSDNTLTITNMENIKEVNIYNILGQVL